MHGNFIELEGNIVDHSLKGIIILSRWKEIGSAHPPRGLVRPLLNEFQGNRNCEYAAGRFISFHPFFIKRFSRESEVGIRRGAPGVVSTDL